MSPFSTVCTATLAGLASGAAGAGLVLRLVPPVTPVPPVMPRIVDVAQDRNGLTEAERGMVVSQGAYPPNGMFGWGGGAYGETFAVQRQIPATNANRYNPVALAGYANSASALAGGVGVYGQGAADADVPGVWGGNFLATNCGAGDVNCSAGGGHSTLTFAIEADANVHPRKDGSAPLGSVFGVHVAGGSTIRPTGDAAGVHVQALGSFAPGVRWKEGVSVQDGAADVALLAGALATDPVNAAGLPGNPVDSPSQPIVLQAYDPSGSPRTTTIQAHTDGSLAMTPAQPGGMLRLGGSVSVQGHLLIQGPQPSVEQCGSGAVVAPNSTDANGAVTIPPGVTVCRLAFGSRFEGSPRAVASTNVPGLSVGVISVEPATAAGNGSVAFGLPAVRNAPVTVTWHVTG